MAKDGDWLFRKAVMKAGLLDDATLKKYDREVYFGDLETPFDRRAGGKSTGRAQCRAGHVRGLRRSALRGGGRQTSCAMQAMP